MTKSSRAVLPVGEAKRRFSELIDRVERGERILVSRRGKLAVALVPARSEADARSAPVGLLAVAGALGDWDDLDDVVLDVYAARRRAKDRAVPDLD
jgi:prevent-host-death family protein